MNEGEPGNVVPMIGAITAIVGTLFVIFGVIPIIAFGIVQVGAIIALIGAVVGATPAQRRSDHGWIAAMSVVTILGASTFPVAFSQLVATHLA